MSSTIEFYVDDYRTKWQRIASIPVAISKANQESLVRSRVQRYSISGDHNGLSSQVGYVNTINTAKIYSDGNAAEAWVVHNPIPKAEEGTRIYTNTIFIQPSCNKM
ncbi:unnamed protein product [Caenorhabditis bovis]|uniref:Uncharacterized protein n=1 Tax=Caenorhabditis bovis TaxID=2654633 RepID=A0A8S1EI56_9PELO|nr:unnamed protein product [Caenorhabditis bovis]